MVPVGLANAPDAVERLLVADVAAERVAGIRRIDDQPALAQDLGGAADQSQLRILGMKLEVLAHGVRVAAQDTAPRGAGIIRAPFASRRTHAACKP